MTPISNNPAPCGVHSGADPNTPQLLVSVRNHAEIADALAGGADIVDLKEPRHGPLAPADVDLWLHAASLWTQRASSRPPWLSAALGEHREAARVASRLPPQFAFAKVGPSRCDSEDKVLHLWSDIRRQLDDRIELVAVAYADDRNAQCIPPEAIFQSAIDAGFRRCLIDTYHKDGQTTIDSLGIDGLRRLAAIAQQGKLWWALAGSIREDCLGDLQHHSLMPHCFGVRGDVCRRGRTGTLSRERVKLWKESLAVVAQPGTEA